MTLAVDEVTCKSALTGCGGSYRLNPYVGCQHRCTYCYATYIARWRGKSGPWGSWVQAKTNVVPVLTREVSRKKKPYVFLSTVCDVYQAIERKYELTRQCLSVLCEAAHSDRRADVFLLTKSDLVQRDADVLAAFPDGTLRVAFSVTTSRDETAALFEPTAPRPSRRFAAAAALKRAGLTVGVLANPILPYVTERDLPALLQAAEDAGLDFVGFDMLHYLTGHVGGKLRDVYRKVGPEAVARLDQARNDPAYEGEVRRLVGELTAGRRIAVETHF